MSDKPIMLIQKKDSPHRKVLAEALERGLKAQVRRAEPKTAADEAPRARLVVWDTCGFGPAEAEALARDLADDEVGVVLACREAGELERGLVHRVGALTLLAGPTSPAAVAAAVDVAVSLHERHQGLRRQRDQQARKLEDRKVIEEAKYVLMRAKGVGEAVAMRRLQKQARDNNLRLVEVARRVVMVAGVFINGNGSDQG